MKKLLGFILILLFFVLAFHSSSANAAKGGKPNPKPTPTAAPIPTVTTTPTPILGNADIGVTITAPLEVASTSSIPYTVTVTNHGPNTATNVEFCSTLAPRQFSLQNIFEGPWSAVVGGDCSVWATLSSLSSGNSAILTYSVNGVASPVQNIVTALSDQTDMNQANNSMSVTTTIQ